MEKKLNHFNKLTGSEKLRAWPVIILMVIMAGGLGLVAGKGQMLVPMGLIALVFGGAFFTAIILRPDFGMWVYLVYVFVMNGLARHVSGVPVGLLMEFILVFVWFGHIFGNFRNFDWSPVKNEMGKMVAIWAIFNMVEFFNPEGPSPAGWFYESRTSFMAWMFVSPMVLMKFTTYRHFRRFVHIVIIMSFIAFLYAYKQVTIGVDSKEAQWLAAGAHTTHVLWGKLRAFSFYSDAGQFGVSQAHVSIIAGVLALGPFRRKLKIIFGIAAFSLIYGMLIAGTRSAIAVPAAGIFLYLIMTKKVKIIVIGLILGGTLFYGLKYTTIMEGNAEIRRLRTALDPEDPSLQTRIKNQAKLQKLLSTRPFGYGVGTIGEWGETYNEHLEVAHIAPDSLLVKQWAMYGVVGFTVWLGFMTYLLGLGVGLAWTVKNQQLRSYVMGITAGNAGVLLASFGQEAMNLMPTTAILTFGWGFLIMVPKFDRELDESSEKELK